MSIKPYVMDLNKQVNTIILNFTFVFLAKLACFYTIYFTFGNHNFYTVSYSNCSIVLLSKCFKPTGIICLNNIYSDSN